MKISAAIAHAGQKEFEVRDVEISEPASDEILVKISGVGICHTDLVVQGAGDAVFPFPAVLGHEGAGIVAAIGKDVTKVVVGDRVAITFRSCGHCDHCEDADAAYCRDFGPLNVGGGRTDGSKSLHCDGQALSGNFFGQSSFASHCLAYERNVVKILDGIPTELAGPLGCGIQTGAGAIINSLAVPSGSSLLVTGGGPVGLSAVMAAKIQGCSTVILVEPQQSRRDFAMEHGATHVIDPSGDVSVPEAVREIIAKGVDFAFDTTGIPAVLSEIMECLAVRGTLGVVGLSAPGTGVPGDINKLVNGGQSIRGIIEGDSNPDDFIPALMDHHLAGRLPFDKMITTYPIGQINQAIQDQHEGKCIKAVLLPG